MTPRLNISISNSKLFRYGKNSSRTLLLLSLALLMLFVCSCKKQSSEDEASNTPSDSMLGQPPQIKFTALDGQEIDLAAYKGKVVLIDFWATWCGPCVGEIPNVKAAYEKYHDQGFEIIGISFDSKKEALEKMIAEKQMPWPQYFDGAGWDNKFGQNYGINSIPTMWLVGKDGNVAHLNARSDLEQKIAQLITAGENI
jgi:thiol-disulfide isomerase/thioredoxin